MRTVVVGTGTIGRAVRTALSEAGQGVVSVGRTSGDVQPDITDEVMHAGTIGTTISHLVEGFVKGAAAEMPRGIRINCVSPTVLAESVAYHDYFVGFTPVPAAEVALAYLRTISTPLNGRILKLHKTDS